MFSVCVCGCVCVFLCLCTGRGLATSRSPAQGVLPTVCDLENRSETKSVMEVCKAQIGVLAPRIKKDDITIYRMSLTDN
jgi:hypothetical protein